MFNLCSTRSWQIPLEDPFFLHGKVGQNNKITYSDTITKNILSAHDVNVEEIVNRAKTL